MGVIEVIATLKHIWVSSSMVTRTVRVELWAQWRTKASNLRHQQEGWVRHSFLIALSKIHRKQVDNQSWEGQRSGKHLSLGCTLFHGFEVHPLSWSVWISHDFWEAQSLPMKTDKAKWTPWPLWTWSRPVPKQKRIPNQKLGWCSRRKSVKPEFRWRAKRDRPRIRKSKAWKGQVALAVDEQYIPIQFDALSKAVQGISSFI